MRRALGCLLLLCAVRPLAAADTQVFASAAQGMPLFGRLGSARLAALGGAFHSLVQGADALMVNPAGLASVQQIQAGAHHESWLADINEETLYAVTPVGQGKAFGAYAHLVDYGVFELRDNAGVRVGQMSARDYAVGVAAGVSSRLGFSGGVGLRGVRENLIQEDVFSLAVDTGVTWQGADGWSGGLAAVNVGPSFSGTEGAESVRWGIARRVDWSSGYVWPALAFSWEPKVAPSMQVGAELGLSHNLALRAGYQHRFVETLLDGVQGLTLGLGFKVGTVGVDYAFLPYGDLGTGHRISVNWTQAPPAPKPAPLPEAPPLQAVAPKPALAYVADPLATAQQLERAGRLGEALAEYERVAQEQPDLLGAWRGIADLAYHLKVRDKCLQAFRQVLRLAPEPGLADWIAAYEAETKAQAAAAAQP